MNDSIKYLCFSLGAEQFAIPLLRVREVLAKPEVTPIPQSPPHFLGMINLRGQVVTLIDLRMRMGIKSMNQQGTVIILDFDNFSLGMVVDSVDTVHAINSNDVAPRPTTEGSPSSEYIVGVFKKDKKLILLIDIAKVLSFTDRKVIEKPQISATSPVQVDHLTEASSERKSA